MMNIESYKTKTLLKDRIFVAHLRSSKREEDGSFFEAGHLEGSVPMPEVVKKLLDIQKERISKGSGTSMNEVNALLKQFEQMKKMMKQFSNPKKMKRSFGGGFPNLFR